MDILDIPAKHVHVVNGFISSSLLCVLGNSQLVSFVALSLMWTSNNFKIPLKSHSLNLSTINEITHRASLQHVLDYLAQPCLLSETPPWRFCSLLTPLFWLVFLTVTHRKKTPQNKTTSHFHLTASVSCTSLSCWSKA